MSSTILFKRSSVAGKVPSLLDLDLGEVALNTKDGKVYIKRRDANNVDSIVDISGNVVGPSSASVDETIATFDGTTGKLLKNNSARITNGIVYNKSFVSEPVVINSTTSTTTLDFSQADNFHITLTSNTTFQLSNIAAKIGSSGNIILKQDGTGGRTFTKSSEMKTPIGGAQIDQWTSANSLSVITYYVVDANTLIINYIGNFA